MFPPANAQIIYNDAGEVMGWDLPYDPDDYYCDQCGGYHGGDCQGYGYDEE